MPIKNKLLTPGLFTVILLASLGNAHAQEEICKDATTARQQADTIDEDIASFRTRQKQSERKAQSEIDAAADKLVATGKWTAQQRQDFFGVQVASDYFTDYEAKKKTALDFYMIAAQSMVNAKKKGDIQTACNGSVGMRTMLKLIGSYNDKQYAHMLEALTQQTRP
ncbi:hypothetical protein ACO0LH_01230 [Undibacterium sp. TJN19]